MRIRAALAMAAFWLSALPSCTGSDAGVRSTLSERDASSELDDDAGLLDVSQDASPSPRDGGTEPSADGSLGDAEMLEPPDAAEAPDPGCSEPSSLSVLGDYWHTPAEEHWLRKNATSVTYSILPSGRAQLENPPQLYRVVRACNSGRFFVATDAAGAVVRVDWERVDAAGTSLRLCTRSEEFMSVDAAIKTEPAVVGIGKVCSGDSWRLLVRQSL